MLPQDFVADCLGFRATRVRRIRARVYARYAFLFTAPALPITGAVGSPINPLAIR